ncbi:unnamed protein product [Polarella glacialis]|uniref:Uncharacterized protein n=1 Tax=Polarella glacialis TaxID=89957 RepID=A0A813KEC1_POLGL|nr:unnamed protein product [Polarella glacialis]
MVAEVVDLEQELAKQDVQNSCQEQVPEEDLRQHLPQFIEPQETSPKAKYAESVEGEAEGSAQQLPEPVFELDETASKHLVQEHALEEDQSSSRVLTGGSSGSSGSNRMPGISVEPEPEEEEEEEEVSAEALSEAEEEPEQEVTTSCELFAWLRLREAETPAPPAEEARPACGQMPAVSVAAVPLTDLADVLETTVAEPPPCTRHRHTVAESVGVGVTEFPEAQLAKEPGTTDQSAVGTWLPTVGSAGASEAQALEVPAVKLVESAGSESRAFVGLPEAEEGEAHEKQREPDIPTETAGELLESTFEVEAPESARTLETESVLIEKGPTQEHELLHAQVAAKQVLVPVEPTPEEVPAPPSVKLQVPAPVEAKAQEAAVGVHGLEVPKARAVKFFSAKSSALECVPEDGDEQAASPDAVVRKAAPLPLHLAASKGSAAEVEELLQSRAEAGASCPKGITPLHVAAQHGHVTVLKALLAAGAPADSLLCCSECYFLFVSCWFCCYLWLLLLSLLLFILILILCPECIEGSVAGSLHYTVLI